MTEPTIRCPNCKTEIKLTESLAAPLIEATRKQYERRLADNDAKAAEREAGLRAREAELAKAQEGVHAQVERQLAAERERIAAEEAEKARRLLGQELTERDRAVNELNEVLRQRDAKLREAQGAQAETIRKQRELDDAKRELELTVEKRVRESLGQVRQKAKQEAEDALHLRVREKEEQIAGMQRQIEDLKRKAEQGSQQLQGEVQELELEALLREHFPRDEIQPVGKGEFGGDVLHHVYGPIGQLCGTILWESKRTKNWSDSWLGKLRDDQRAAKADVALIVSQALPKTVQTFGYVDTVWVAEPKCAVPVAIALRESLIAVSRARAAGEGQMTKMELVYEYLTGPRFKQRVEAIVEKFADMQADLDRERRTMTKLWAKREAQIRGVVEATAGMYGDLQGIAGQSLEEIEALDVALLAGPEERSEATADEPSV